MSIRKIIAASLTLVTVVALSGVATPASAATAAELQAQIAQLMAQINALNGQLGTTTGGSTASVTFTRDLTVGSRGTEVTALQNLLISAGFMKGTATGYFGGLTKAALVKYQKANGITPASGYFGPKSRAFVNAQGTTTGGNTTGGNTTGGTTTPAANSVTLSKTNPASANIAVGAVNTPVTKLTFTAGAAPLTVTALKVTRTGLSQDTDLQNVYLYDGATRLASNLGISNGKINFANASGLFTVPAGTSKDITVAVDTTNATSSASHVLQFSVASADDITASTAVAGTYPIMGSSFTLVSVSNLATLTITGTSTSATNVNAGQTSYLAGQMTLTAGQNPVKISAIRLTNVGSISPSALQNVKLMQGSTQLGATIGTLDSSNVANFDMSAAPLMLASGQSVTLSIYVDVTGAGIGTIGRTFQFSIQQAADILAMDNNYGVGISAVGTGNATAIYPVSFYSVTVNGGGLVMSRNAASPATNVVAGNTNQVLAKIDLLASGDSVRVNQLNFQTVAAGSALSNVRVVDDQGTQLGTTQTTLAAGTQTFSVGSGSLNYVIPANTTRTLTVYGDVSSSGTGTVQVSITGGSAQSNTTYGSITVGSSSGNALTILTSGSNLTASLNYALGTPTISAGTTAAKIASFNLTAGQVNTITLTGVSATTTASTTLAGYMQNLKAMIGTTQLGTTQATITAGNSYTFNASSPITIPASGVVTVDFYADFTNSATSSIANSLISLTGVNANVTGGNTVSTSNVVGQSVVLTLGGTITGTTDAATPATQYVGMGVTNSTIAKYRFSTGTTGSATLTQVVLADLPTTTATTTVASYATDRSFVNYKLVNGATTLATASEASNGTITFNIAGLAVPANSYNTLSVVADVNAYPYASSSAAHAWQLASFTYTNASGATTATTSAVSNLLTVHRTNLTVAQGPTFNAPTSISAGSGSIVAQFNFTADSGFDALVRTVSLSQAGSLVSSTPGSVVTLNLYGSDNPSLLLGTVIVTSTSATTSGVLNTTGWTIPAGQTLTLIAKLSSATGLNTVTSGTGSYQLSLQGVAWNDSVLNVASLDPKISLPIAGQTISGLSN